MVELEIPEDHIHMVVRSEPKLSPSQIMQEIKSISAREFFKLYPDIKNVISGEVNFGLRVISLKQLEMQRKI